MKALLDKIVEGYELPPITKKITLDKMRSYEGWPEAKNIHSDEEIARKAGLSQPVCRGTTFLAYVSEMICNVFGEYWLKGSKLSATLLVPVFPGDTVTAKGKITQRMREGSNISFNIEVWVENQRGEKVAVGTASLRVPQQRQEQ